MSAAVTKPMYVQMAIIGPEKTYVWIEMFRSYERSKEYEVVNFRERQADVNAESPADIRGV